MKIKISITLLLTAVLLLGSLGAGSADLYFESQQITKGIPGQPDDTATIKQYLTTDFTMTDMGDVLTIIDMNKKILHELDRETKTYRSTEIDKLGGMPGMGPEAKELEENPMFKAMMESMAKSFKVTPTDEYKTIAGYNCRKFIVEVMMSTSEYWVTKEFEGYDEMKVIGEKSARLFANNPMMKQMNISGMLNSLDGYPVQTITQMMGGSIQTTLIKMERKKIDRALFAIPAGYTRAKD